ncbi:hypothetical protein M8J77_011822 [Diaphorina citri]|nr:hypothetical protein M8J77_011822 [Diaphorina citri]
MFDIECKSNSPVEAGMKNFLCQLLKNKLVFKDKQTEEDNLETSSDNKHSSIVTIFSIWNTIMGTSILTIPWAIHQAGFATAICLMLGSTALCLYTAWRILKIQSLHGGGKGEVADLSKILLGRYAEVTAQGFSFIILLGADVIYWILMSNFLYFTVSFIHDQIVGSDPNSLISEIAPGNVICPVKVVQQVNESLMSSVSNVSTTQMGSSLYRTLWNLEYTVPIVLVFFLGPLINIKSPSFFTRFNSSGTLSVLFLIIFVFIKAWRWGINVDFKNSDSISYVSIFSLNFPATTGVLALSMFIHNIIITIMRNNRHQEHNGRDLSIAYLLVFLTYAAVGLIFYVTFPLAKSCIQDNLLNNFLRHDVLTLAARMFLLFQLTTVYPLITYMLRVQIFAALKKPPYPGFYQVLFLNTAIVTVCVLFAIFLPQIGTVLRFTGALGGFIYIFTLPSILHLSSQNKREQMSILSFLFHSFIVLLGFLNLVAQFFVH